ncbi:MAG: glycosyltransferase family 4 protein [Gemmataceae bacterium]
MMIAFCYESVFPSRGGCATYITDLARKLLADEHEVQLYACRWDENALPEGIAYRRLPAPRGPRFLKPWRFAAACNEALAGGDHHVSIGFDKTYGQDVLYPQGGLHAASHVHNLNKHRSPLVRCLAALVKAVDPAHRSYARLERKQYLGSERPLMVAISSMVWNHFQHFYGINADDLRLVRTAIDPARFPEHDRLRCRMEGREQWGIGPNETVGLILAMNYHLKGLEPLLYAVRRLVSQHPAAHAFRLLVAGSPKYAAYQKLARRLGIDKHICFAGFCGEARQAYFAADFLVHPTFYDPCSLVVLEALACGLPVITTRYNGASEFLTPPREGYVIDDPHDQNQLAWCMGQLLEPSRRSACAQAARRTAAQWTFDHHYRNILQVFTEAAARRRAA